MADKGLEEVPEGTFTTFGVRCAYAAGCASYAPHRLFTFAHTDDRHVLQDKSSLTTMRPPTPSIR